MSTRLFVDSRDRISSSAGTHDFVINLPEHIRKISKVELSSLNVPNTIYNINSSNNVIPVVISSVTYNATLTPGSYTDSTLIVEAQSKINTAVTTSTGQTFTITFNATTYKLTFASTGSFQINFASSSSPWRECGFANALTTAGTSATGSNVAQLGLPYELFIVIEQLSHGSPIRTTNPTLGHYTFICPLNGNGGSVSSYSEDVYTQHIHFNPPLSSIDRLTVRLLDRNASAANLNGADFSMILNFVH
jgi:hypothetical protein